MPVAFAVSTGALLGACTDDPIDREAFAPVTVDAESLLTTANEVESVTVVEYETFDLGSELLSDPVITTAGVPCAGATDAASCNDALDELLAAPSEIPVVLRNECFQCETSNWAIVTTGTAPNGEVNVWTREDVASRIAPIDSPLEVALAFGELVRVREDGQMWKLIRSEIVENCDPVVTETVEYTMDRSGRHEPGRTERTEESGCI